MDRGNAGQTLVKKQNGNAQLIEARGTVSKQTDEVHADHAMMENKSQKKNKLLII